MLSGDYGGKKGRKSAISNKTCGNTDSESDCSEDCSRILHICKVASSPTPQGLGRSRSEPSQDRAGPTAQALMSFGAFFFGAPARSTKRRRRIQNTGPIATTATSASTAENGTDFDAKCSQISDEVNLQEYELRTSSQLQAYPKAPEVSSFERAEAEEESQELPDSSDDQ